MAGFAAPLIGAGSSLLSGWMGSKAADKAAKLQQANAAKVADITGKAVSAGQEQIAGGVQGVKDATQQGQADVTSGVSGANQTLEDAIKAQLELYRPYIEQGGSSLNSLAQLTGEGGPLANKFSFEGKDLANDPGYKFTLAEGQKAIQRSAAARGGLFSGGTLKSLAGYTTGTADQYFNDAFSRAKSTFDTNQNTALARIGSLQQLANLGYGGTSSAAGVIGSNYGQQASNTLGGSQFRANLGLAGAGQVLGGSEASADLGLRGAGIVGSAMTGGANAGAAGTVGSTNSWLNALGGANKSIQEYLAGKQFASLNGMAAAPSGTYNPNGSVALPWSTPTMTPPYVPAYR